jgi:hypothetical protein
MKIIVNNVIFDSELVPILLDLKAEDKQVIGTSVNNRILFTPKNYSEEKARKLLADGEVRVRIAQKLLKSQPLTADEEERVNMFFLGENV